MRKKWYFQLIQKVSALLCVCLICILAFHFLYIHDNKYTLRPILDENNRVLLDEEHLQNNRIFSLFEGWEFYPDTFIKPGEAATAKVVPVPMFIGEYLSFSDFHDNKEHFGTGTYRLRLSYSGTPVSCTLIIPELFSACQVYADGQLVAGRGSLTPYSPSIGDVAASFIIDNDVELVIQTANYTHYYSGITYPPVLGTAAAINTMTSVRMILYGILCFSALAVALFSAAVWLGTGKYQNHGLPLWFAGLALSFVIRISYPFLHLIELPFTRILYALEDGSALFALYCAAHIILITGTSHIPRLNRLIYRFSFGMTIVTIIIPLFILPYFPAYTGIYGQLISWYKLLAAILLTILALMGQERKGSLWIVCGITGYAVSLCLSVTTMNRFEPIYGLWTDEYGTYLLVFCFAVMMVMENNRIVKENQCLTAHLQEEVDKKTQQISKLVDERQKLLSEFLHDLKSPVSSLLTYTHLIRENSILLDSVTKEQLEIIEHKGRDVSTQIQTMQEFSTENPMLSHFKDVDLCDLLKTFYRYNKPDVEVYGPDFLLDIPTGPILIRADSEKLKRVLQNLIYNAVSFTPEDGCICLALKRQGETAVITVRDNGCGIAEDKLHLVFNRSFTSRREDGGRGLGLYIARTIVQEHGGEISVTSVVNEGSTFKICLPVK